VNEGLVEPSRRIEQPACATVRHKCVTTPQVLNFTPRSRGADDDGWRAIVWSSYVHDPHEDMHPRRRAQAMRHGHVRASSSTLLW